MQHRYLPAHSARNVPILGGQGGAPGVGRATREILYGAVLYGALFSATGQLLDVCFVCAFML